MKSKHLIFFVILHFAVVALASEGQPTYSFKFKVNGLSNTSCFLAYHYGDKKYLKDTAKVDAEGNFTFEGNNPLDGGAYLVVLPDKSYFEIIVNEQNFKMETDTADYVKNMKITGSEENTIFYNYLNFLISKNNEFVKQQENFAYESSKEGELKDINDYRLNVIKNHPNTFVAKIFQAMIPIQVLPSEKAISDSIFRKQFQRDHYFDQIDFSDGRIVRTPLYHKKLKEYFETIVSKNADSIIASSDKLLKKTEPNKEIFKYTVWYITTKYETSPTPGAELVFIHMVKKYYETGKAFWVDPQILEKIINRANSLVLKSKKTFDLAIKDSTGTCRKLQDQKSRFTFVYFWYPDSPQSQQMTLALNKVYQKHKENDLSVFAINMGNNSSDWLNFIQKYDLTWTNVYDYNQISALRIKYDISATSVLYILDINQNIIAKRVTPQQADEILSKLIKQKEKNAKAGPNRPNKF
ncbi:MAG: DUF5106 domain-containing protein [Sporocytophaga sp.]|uniref:TlpA family protein disulfide reductase n=1 Tax=Sporocytophaga sp. TaxID=2231183 RepID=UPI001B18DB89|nr:TlpA family protein disulfide reductase [Sporocytophaga sp.]MBO9698698.1 DUF5106 domain-containing protein [Sporocytophaga sp.]